MERKRSGLFIRFLTLVTFIGMIAVNALANTLPLNGVTTGEVSNSYGNLFAPAGYTFAVWGVIYLLLAFYTLYQLGLFQGDKSKVKRELLNKIGILFSISSVANAAWIFSWHYGVIPLSMLFMVVILLCLILITLAINKENLSVREKVFIKLPFSIYFGWITVATIANATVLLVSLGWDGFGIPEPVWAIIIIIVSALIAVSVILRFRDFAYGLVIIWAYLGILVKHISENGFAATYPAVIAAVVACIVLVGIDMVHVLFPAKRERKAT